MRQIARWVAAAGMIAMGAAIGYALLIGDFAREGAILTALPWGIVSLVDLYTGFVLVALWVVYREAARPIAWVWVVAILVLGNLATAVYVLWVLRRSGADARRFFLGARA